MFLYKIKHPFYKVFTHLFCVFVVSYQRRYNRELCFPSAEHMSFATLPPSSQFRVSINILIPDCGKLKFTPFV
jgi:hypothetical protein